jgi:hypothetical protein
MGLLGIWKQANTQTCQGQASKMGGNPLPRGQIQVKACFYVAYEPRMVFIPFNG